MRDRRNTSLSVSSTGSSNSTFSNPGNTSEKRVASPPTTPTLPFPVTKENTPKSSWRRLLPLRIAVGICCLLLLGHLVLRWSSSTSRGHYGVRMLDLDAGNDLPDQPTALIVSRRHSPDKWTVSIPHNATFPLRAQQYAGICKQGETLRDELAQLSKTARLRSLRRKPSYYTQDWTFIDVADAETVDALPAPSEKLDGVCSNSLTFVLDGRDASFGKTLLLLWLSYGLALKEGRAFFIEDTGWPYGRYTSYFAPPPSQNCARPPAHYILPCPHQARHLVVSAATARWTFSSLFDQEFLLERTSGAGKYRRIFDMLRTGYEDLFKLIGEDASYAPSRVAEMKASALEHGGSVVGMHVRRGDLHPHEYQFGRDYLPLERYAATARALFRSLLEGREVDKNSSDMIDFSTVLEYVHSPLLLASDDPDIISADELSQAASPFKIQRAQERIQLATKKILDETSPVKPYREPGSAYVKHVDENSGWEGGFHNKLFFSLGIDMATGGSLERLSQLPDARSAVPEQAMRMRELVGKAYLLDLAIIGGSDGVVCAVSSATCRILGVMMGWDAVSAGRWMNVDDGRPWSWDGRQ